MYSKMIACHIGFPMPVNPLPLFVCICLQPGTWNDSWMPITQKQHRAADKMEMSPIVQWKPCTACLPLNQGAFWRWPFFFVANILGSDPKTNCLDLQCFTYKESDYLSETRGTRNTTVTIRVCTDHKCLMSRMLSWSRRISSFVKVQQENTQETTSQRRKLGLVLWAHGYTMGNGIHTESLTNFHDAKSNKSRERSNRASTPLLKHMEKNELFLQKMRGRF